MNKIENAELNSLVARIISSGELGRSKTYAAILTYLAECSLAGTSPKEMAIAVDVLGRDADFDVAKESIVRVHIYHLRNKLKAYFAKHDKTEKYRIEIPKGQYIITAVLNKEDAASGSKKLSVTGKPLNRNPMTLWMGAFLALLLLMNLLIGYLDQTEGENQKGQSSFGPWLGIMDDEEPILIVVGDYYIVGELDEIGNVSRLVREFNINSVDDLEFEQNVEDSPASRYFNLDLGYIPTSTAFALAKIMPMLIDSNGKAGRVKVTMMSKLNTSDLVGNHIIYLGYLSGLDRLEDMIFSNSGLAIGSSYDELYRIENDKYFASSSGLSIGENNYLDYGMLSSRVLPNQHQLIMIAGMRDEGLINVSQQATNILDWSDLREDLGMDAVAYEALYEVYGFDSINFDAKLVYSKILASEPAR